MKPKRVPNDLTLDEMVADLAMFVFWFTANPALHTKPFAEIDAAYRAYVQQLYAQLCERN